MLMHEISKTIHLKKHITWCECARIKNKRTYRWRAIGWPFLRSVGVNQLKREQGRTFCTINAWNQEALGASVLIEGQGG